MDSVPSSSISPMSSGSNRAALLIAATSVRVLALINRSNGSYSPPKQDKAASNKGSTTSKELA